VDRAGIVIVIIVVIVLAVDHRVGSKVDVLRAIGYDNRVVPGKVDDGGIATTTTTTTAARSITVAIAAAVVVVAGSELGAAQHVGRRPVHLESVLDLLAGLAEDIVEVFVDVEHTRLSIAGVGIPAGTTAHDLDQQFVAVGMHLGGLGKIKAKGRPVAANGLVVFPTAAAAAACSAAIAIVVAIVVAIVIAIAIASRESRTYLVELIGIQKVKWLFVADCVRFRIGIVPRR
jgi:hypothetical protein